MSDFESNFETRIQEISGLKFTVIDYFIDSMETPYMYINNSSALDFCVKNKINLNLITFNLENKFPMLLDNRELDTFIFSLDQLENYFLGEEEDFIDYVITLANLFKAYLGKNLMYITKHTNLDSYSLTLFNKEVTKLFLNRIVFIPKVDAYFLELGIFQ